MIKEHTYTQHTHKSIGSFCIALTKKNHLRKRGRKDSLWLKFSEAFSPQLLAPCALAKCAVEARNPVDSPLQERWNSREKGLRKRWNFPSHVSCDVIFPPMSYFLPFPPPLTKTELPVRGNVFSRWSFGGHFIFEHNEERECMIRAEKTFACQ